jgi:hypothetical protein
VHGNSVARVPGGGTFELRLQDSRVQRLSLALGALALLAAGGCNTVTNYPTTVLRPAQDAPERFVLEDSSAITGTPGAAPCRSPIVDPRTGARLMMERAYRGNGDYSVPGAAYGVRAGELLRVDCANGQPIGIVRG